MAEHDDLEFLEVLRTWTQEHELQYAADHHVAKRPEQEPTPREPAGRAHDSTADTHVAGGGTELTHPTGSRRPARRRRAGVRPPRRRASSSATQQPLEAVGTNRRSRGQPLSNARSDG